MTVAQSSGVAMVFFGLMDTDIGTLRAMDAVSVRLLIGFLVIVLLMMPPMSTLVVCSYLAMVTSMKLALGALHSPWMMLVVLTW